MSSSGMTLDPLSAVSLSVAVGLASTLSALVPALIAGRWLARTSFAGRSLVSAAILVPMVLPPVVTGLLLLELLGRNTVVGGWLAAVGLPIPFTLLGAVLAAAVVGFPLYVLAIRQAFEAVDPRYEEVAATLGDRPLRAFLRVSLPLALPGIAAGAVLAFARGLGEFGATVVLAGNVEGRTRTIALAVYTLLDGPDDDPRLRWLVGISVALALAALVAYEALVRWSRRRLEVEGD
jgi:molybdate transport system permease protein